MIISPISFGSASFAMYMPEKEDKNGRKEFNKEIRTAYKAREAHVSVPVYKSTEMRKSSFGFKYEVEGDPADPVKNPIGQKHFHNLFKNLYYMDKAGIYHNDLDTNHVFFSNSGKVEFDCFRYACDFQTKGGIIENKDIRTPVFAAPSNAEGFEYANLGEYVSKIENEDEKFFFVEEYLMAKGDYHKRREQMLLDEGFKPEDDVVRYEHVQSVVFNNPSMEVIDYTIDKLELNYMRRKAFTLWDEGGGACGHPVNPIKRFDGVLGNMEVMQKAAKLRDLAKDMTKNCSREEDGEYFEFEKKYCEYWLKNLHRDTRGMGGWTFNDNKLQNGLDIFIGTQSEKRNFEKLYDRLNPDEENSDDFDKQVRDVGIYYLALAKRWTPKLNEKFRNEYYIKLGRFPKN